MICIIIIMTGVVHGLWTGPNTLCHNKCCLMWSFLIEYYACLSRAKQADEAKTYLSVGQRELDISVDISYGYC
jgi:hypothetical protein